MKLHLCLLSLLSLFSLVSAGDWGKRSDYGLMYGYGNRFTPYQVPWLNPAANYNGFTYSKVEYLGVNNGVMGWSKFNRGWYGTGDYATYWRLMNYRLPGMSAEQYYIAGGLVNNPFFFNTIGMDMGFEGYRFVANFPHRTLGNVYIPKFCRGVGDYLYGNPYVGCLDFDMTSGLILNPYEFYNPLSMTGIRWNNFHHRFW